jgi:hypothetical protein
MKQQYRHTKPYRGKDPDFTSEFDKEIARETAKYIAETTPEERAEDDHHLQRGYDESKGEAAFLFRHFPSGGLQKI